MRPTPSGLKRLAAAVLTTAALVLPACDAATLGPAEPQDDDSTTEPAPELDPLYDPISLAVTLAETEVALGDEIVFRVRLKNGGSAATKVNVPRFGRNSLSFRVRKDARVNQMERLNADLDLNTGRMLWKPGEVKQLATGETLDAEVRLIAVATGKYTFTPVYRRMGAAALTSEPVAVEVVSVDGKGTLGVHMETSHGKLTIKLRPDLALNTVESFASLVKKGFYDGLTFHRVVKGFMAQGGDPKADGSGGPGYFLPLEAHTRLLHRRGVLSMARTGIPDTAGSQFFLLFTRYPSLDPGRGSPGYTVFGEVVEGDQTLRNLEAVGAQPTGPGQPEAPSERVTIKKATLKLLK